MFRLHGIGANGWKVALSSCQQTRLDIERYHYDEPYTPLHPLWKLLVGGDSVHVIERRQQSDFDDDYEYQSEVPDAQLALSDYGSDDEDEKEPEDFPHYHRRSWNDWMFDNYFDSEDKDMVLHGVGGGGEVQNEDSPWSGDVE